MKIHRALAFALILLTGFTTLWSQDSEPDLFIQNVLRTLERLNWDKAETEGLKRHLEMLEWKNLEGVDPEVVALALSYCREKGVENLADYADIAGEVADGVREMSKRGFTSRESAVAMIKGIRLSAPDSAGFADQIREQVRNQTQDATGKAIRKRAVERTERPKDSDSWTPPAVEERPNDGRAGIPPGPDEIPSPGGSNGSNGGK